MVSLQELYTHIKTLTRQWVYTKEEVEDKLDDKVDKETGKGLSSNDYTTAEKTKLANIEAEANKTIVDTALDDSSTNPVRNSVVTGAFSDVETEISSIQDEIDGLHTVASSGSYLDLENIPATFTPSSHTHNTGEVTDPNAHANLGTSADATQSTINTAIDSRIASLLSIDYQEIVLNLPTASKSTMNKFYLVAEAEAENNDEYEIFITVETPDEVEQGEEQTYSYDWEKVDSARIDLTGKSDIDHVHGNITNDGKIGSVADKVLVTGTGGLITVTDDLTLTDNTIQALIDYGVALETPKTLNFTILDNGTPTQLIVRVWETNHIYDMNYMVGTGTTGSAGGCTVQNIMNGTYVVTIHGIPGTAYVFNNIVVDNEHTSFTLDIANADDTTGDEI